MNLIPSKDKMGIETISEECDSKKGKLHKQQDSLGWIFLII
jgi:hypothetical protein